MTPQSELELQGTFFAHPFAELVAEIGQARLDGSLRLSDKDKKCVVYFKNGRIAFAVSNARSSRLFDILLRRNRLSEEEITKVPNFSNDFELASALENDDLLTKQECDALFKEQIEVIIRDILLWPAGDWSFSHLARIRDGLAFDIDSAGILVEFARSMPVDLVLQRFRSLDESFSRSELLETDHDLQPEEAFVLSRALDGPLSAENLTNVSAMPDATALHLMYTLWLAGLLVRDDFQSAFSKPAIAAMKNAILELKQEARLPNMQEQVVEAPEPEIVADAPPAEPEINVEDYLTRVENAKTYYDILGVDAKADIAELKQAYFFLAKNFHPDRFHAEGGKVFKRAQHAFTELAQAHETLKSVESREVYDYRIRKELSERERLEADGNDSKQGAQIDQASKNFENGYSLLMENEPEAAVPFLARAVHFDPQNARYHAYYGKALSADKNQRHKAESEMQKAVKLDPNNSTFRLILAEFFIQFSLLKRAEGELTRLLAKSPNNRDARDLLAKLKR